MQDLTTFTSAILLVTILYVGQNLIRYARAKDANGVLGIVLAVVLGVGVAWIAAQADVTSGLVLIEGGGKLGNLDGGSLLLLGVALGTAGSTFHDLKSAFDNQDTAKKPALVPPSND